MLRHMLDYDRFFFCDLLTLVKFKMILFNDLGHLKSIIILQAFMNTFFVFLLFFTSLVQSPFSL